MFNYLKRFEWFDFERQQQWLVMRQKLFNLLAAIAVVLLIAIIFNLGAILSD